MQAAATLGLNLGLQGDSVRSRRLLDYAQKLSRRDLQTQFWAIEDAVGRGDVAAALMHYDTALRTSTTAHDVLFPVLAGATADPTIRFHLIATLAKKPLWGEAFITWIANAGTRPDAIARLFLGLRQASVTLTPETLALATDRLIALGSVDQAWLFYAATHPGADKSRSRDPKFNTSLNTPSVFDWQPVNDGTVAASIQRGDQGNMLDFAVPPGIGGVLVRQMEMLPSGDYRIEGHSRAIDQSEASLPYWILTCSNGREVGRVSVLRSAQANGLFAGHFSVPADCPTQTLALVAKASDDVGGVAGQIDWIRVVPNR